MYTPSQRRRFLEKKILETKNMESSAESTRFRKNHAYDMQNKLPKVKNSQPVSKHAPENVVDTLTIRKRKTELQIGKPLIINDKPVTYVKCPVKKAEGYGNSVKTVSGKTLHTQIHSRFKMKNKKKQDDRVFSQSSKLARSGKSLNPNAQKD